MEYHYVKKLLNLGVDPIQNGQLIAILDFCHNTLRISNFVSIHCVAPPYCMRCICTICDQLSLAISL